MASALRPDAQVPIRVAWGFRKQDAAVMAGKSVTGKESAANVGGLRLKYGGGRHDAGACQLENDEADAKLPGIIAALNEA